MTDQAPRDERAAQPPKRTRKPGPFGVAAASLASFLALFALLAHELRTGHDPALGAAGASSQAQPVKRILVRKVEDRVVVTKLLPPRGDDGGEGGGQVVVTQAPASAATSSAPVVTSAPAPAPAPTPAPTTRAS